MIAQELEVSLHMAFVEARQQRHEFITVEHLLMALLDNPSAAEVLRACAANIEDLRKSLATFIKENTPTVGGSDEVDLARTAQRFDDVEAAAEAVYALIHVDYQGRGGGRGQARGDHKDGATSSQRCVACDTEICVRYYKLHSWCREANLLG